MRETVVKTPALDDTEYIRPTYLPIQVTGQVQAFDSAIPVTADEEAGAEDRPVTGRTSIWQPLPSGKMVPMLRLPKQGTSLEEVERVLVTLALRQSEGNQTQAAKLLDISRDALRYKMTKFGFEVRADSSPE